jgi:probable phosphoglycerate mutase
MAIVVLIRSGCTDFDEQQRIQGSLDLPLNKRGEEQVRQLCLELGSVPLEILYTSPCEPARSTAAALGLELGLPVKELEGLRNFDQGLWQGLQIEDIRRKHPKVFKQWQESPETICPPQGETVAAANERIRKALEKPLKRGISFAIVASEPLATLVCCFVTGRKLDLTESTCHAASQKQWEYLRTNGHGPAGPAASDSELNAVDAALTPVHRGEPAP